MARCSLMFNTSMFSVLMFNGVINPRQFLSEVA
jgi:hypothetical protein